MQQQSLILRTMHIGHNNPQHTYTMKGQALQKTTEETDIGVKVTNMLKPSAQCQKAARTAQTVLSQLSRAFHYRDRHIFIRLYVQYVRPHLEFASPAWSPWQEADKECLEKVQKRAVSMVSGLSSAQYEDRLKELGLTTLEERRHQLDMLQTFKILAGKDKVDKSTWFTMSSESDRVTRATADPLSIRIPFPGKPPRDQKAVLLPESARSVEQNTTGDKAGANANGLQARLQSASPRAKEHGRSHGRDSAARKRQDTL